jgi:Tfp pilus assembly protein FimV
MVPHGPQQRARVHSHTSPRPTQVAEERAKAGELSSQVVHVVGELNTLQRQKAVLEQDLAAAHTQVRGGGGTGRLPALPACVPHQ